MYDGAKVADWAFCLYQNFLRPFLLVDAFRRKSREAARLCWRHVFLSCVLCVRFFGFLAMVIMTASHAFFLTAHGRIQRAAAHAVITQITAQDTAAVVDRKASNTAPASAILIAALGRDSSPPPPHTVRGGDQDRTHTAHWFWHMPCTAQGYIGSAVSFRHAYTFIGLKYQFLPTLAGASVQG